MVKVDVFEKHRGNNYLRRLAESDVGRHYKAIALEQLDIRPGHTVVDLGCGPGTDLGGFAAATGPAGRVVGIDSDATALAEAQSDIGAGAPIQLVHGDIHSLGLPDATADRAHTDRVLQHVADPARVLDEIRRILRPDGIVVLAEPDWDTLIIDHPDLDIARAYTRFVTDVVVRNGRIGRQLPRLAIGCGFHIAEVLPITTVFRDVTTADRVLGFERVTDRAVAAGYLTRDAAGRWLTHLATEPFFAAATLFIVVAVPGTRARADAAGQPPSRQAIV
ncbi:methyltransferase domain-containing protein [Nocardia africana]